MALTESNAFANGTIAPGFSLFNTVNDETASLDHLKGNNGTVIMFICNHCPFVIHVNEELVNMANDYQDKGIAFIAISSNDSVNYPQDGPVRMKELALKMNYPFPYLYDETQEVAKAYDAACTPDFYLFDDGLKAVYHGQMDGSRPGNNIPVTGSDLRKAIEAILSQSELSSVQNPSIGCGIKWK